MATHDGSDAAFDGRSPFEDAALSPGERALKRKLQRIEHEIRRHNKRSRTRGHALRERLLLLDVDIATKAALVRRFDEQVATAHGSERN